MAIVDHQLRFTPAFQHARDVLQGGAIGAVVALDVAAYLVPPPPSPSLHTFSPDAVHRRRRRRHATTTTTTAAAAAAAAAMKCTFDPGPRIPVPDTSAEWLPVGVSCRAGGLVTCGVPLRWLLQWPKPLTDESRSCAIGHAWLSLQRVSCGGLHTCLKTILIIGCVQIHPN